MSAPEISGRSIMAQLHALAPIRQVIRPEHEAHWHALRAQDLTSTDVAALFGLSPYKTHFELWHEKRAGEVVAFEENERMKWGRRLESSVAQGICEDRGWIARPMKEYIRLEGLRLGASFDWRVLLGMPAEGKTVDFDSFHDAHLEIKCVDWLQFKNGWIIEDGFIEAPAHIEVQVQHQMLVSGLKRAYIGAMVGGNDIRILEREADPDTQRAIMQAARAFWASIDANAPPPPVMPQDADAVIALNAFASPGKLFDARQDAEIPALIADYHRIGREIAKLDEAKKVRKAEILEKIGDSEKVLVDGYSVSAGMVGPTSYHVDREGYRNFRVVEKKAKPA